MINIYTYKKEKEIKNFWNNIHFHPTDAIEDEWGQKILNEVAHDKVAEVVRMYTMMEDIATMDEEGKLSYDFTENDVRMDYMVKKGFRLFLSFAFIPPCIAEHPNLTSSVSKNKTRYKGKMITVSKPIDYKYWEEICYNYTLHIVKRYGLETVKTWYLQCYNEPDIPLFFMAEVPDADEGAMERLVEYIKLYDAFSKGILRVSKDLKIGGPSVGLSYSFFEGFIKNCAQKKIRLDFIGIHTYGVMPKDLCDGTRPLNARNTIELHNKYLKIIKKYFKDEDKEIIVDEWGAAGWGFCNVSDYPKLMFREDNTYSVYMGKMISAYIKDDIKVDRMMICLSGQHEMTEDFSGFRNFFTMNFIKKPIYNAFVLLRKLQNRVNASEWDCENTDVLSTGDQSCGAVLITYSSGDFEGNLPTLHDKVKFFGLNGKYSIKLWKIDNDNTNPYDLYKSMGCPKMDEDIIKTLRECGNLKCKSCKITDELDIELTDKGLMVIEYERIGE